MVEGYTIDANEVRAAVTTDSHQYFAAQDALGSGAGDHAADVSLQPLSSSEVFSTSALFRSLPTSNFLHSLSITSILGHMHGAVNVCKKNN
jgi:hypothetical protein